MIEIITDSTCDIPADLVARYSIRVVPTVLVWSGKTYRDRIDIQPVDFYKRLATEPDRPTTSTPSPEDFRKVYEEAIQRRAEGIVVLSVSAAMSSTYQTAVQTAPRDRVPVEVIDARGPSMSLGWQVLAAARARDAGADMGAIVQAAAAVRRTLMTVVSMETLEYLQRGGRIGQAVKWIGVALKVKPVVAVNHNSGIVEPLGLAHTQRAGIEMMFSRFVARMRTLRDLHVAVLHGNAPEQAASLADRLRRDLAPTELLINITGPVLGANTGPGALELCGYGEGG